MIVDAWIVARKEWREMFVPGGTVWGGAWSEGLIVIGALGGYIAYQIGPAWVQSEVALYWLWLPLLQMTGMIAESIAGERERRTLETLLASRLPDRAILFGKLAAALAYGWGLTLACLAVGAATVSLAHRTPLFYVPSVAASLAGLSLLGGIFVAGVGALISLSAPTVRQAYQRLSIALLLAFLPIFSTQYLPPAWRAAITPTEQTWPWIALAAFIALVLLDWWLLAAADSQFRRVRLLAR